MAQAMRVYSAIIRFGVADSLSRLISGTSVNQRHRQFSSPPRLIRGVIRTGYTGLLKSFQCPTARVKMATAAHTHTNRLAETTSPYLLQHQHNPVDWYTWGTDAFEKAKAEDKPIFLSIGYSTCHWCHVMERESFESDHIAGLLNQSFVSIKVDKEERPDVDKVYMTYVQATSGGGGWPMSVFLTPGLQPFFGGTYFPPDDAYARPGFATVLKRVAEVWQIKKEDIIAQSASVVSQLEAAMKSEGSQSGAMEGAVASRVLQKCASQMQERFDAVQGGFGTAPKFPRPCEIDALLAWHALAGSTGNASAAEKALNMATLTLTKMAAGGMYDHVGGGFHRYSVDEFWHVPHFEKMLYDNPQLVMSYLDAFAVTGDASFAWVARGVLDYMQRDLLDSQGGFYSAEDADSLNKMGKKTEGAYYLWTEAEVDEALGQGSDAAALFKQHYYVKAAGNCDLSPRSDQHNEFSGLNCLIARKPLAELASSRGLDLAAAEELLAEAREKLHTVRKQRPRPHLDDKIVAAWNGMALSVFAVASRVLAAESQPAYRRFPVEGCKPQEYLHVALKVARFAKASLWDESSRRLRRSYRNGPSDVAAFADDYAYLIRGLLDLHSVTGDTADLQWALQLQHTLDELFWDPVAGGYFSTEGGDPSILLRMKEDYDGAEPAATSIAVGNLLKLSALTEGEAAQQLHRKACDAAGAFQDRLEDVPMVLPALCASLFPLTTGHFQQVIVAGRAGQPDTESLMDAAHAAYAPNKVVILVDESNASTTAFWQKHNPQILAMAQSGASKGKAQAYICQDFSCKAPTSDPAVVRQTLASSFTPKAKGPVTQTVDLSQLGRH